VSRIGRPRKPDAAKRLEGTFRPDRERSGVVDAPPAMPERPEYLTAGARKEWDRVAHFLVEYGLIAAGDGAVLEGYCCSYGRAVEAEKALKKHGLIIKTPYGPQVNPAAAIARQNWEAVRKFASEFGLSIGGRQGIKVPERPKEDATEGFLFGAGLKAIEGGKVG
jgi:P27 family predicted phage terminase small subunit